MPGLGDDVVDGQRPGNACPLVDVRGIGVCLMPYLGRGARGAAAECAYPPRCLGSERNTGLLVSRTVGSSRELWVRSCANN